VAVGNPASRGRPDDPAGRDTGRGAAGRGGQRGAAGRGLSTRAGARARGGRRGAGRTASSRTNTFWLPIAAAVGVLILLLCYVLAHQPSHPAAGGGSLGAAAAKAGFPDATASGAAGSTRSSPAAVVAVPTGPSGCQTGKTLPSGVTTQTVAVGSVKRTYLLSVPQSAPNAGPSPLILDFHAAGQSPLQAEADTGLAGTATKRGYVVAYPAGVDNRWNVTRTAGADDVPFVAAVLGDLRTRGCMADNKVFAAGLGDGADMAMTASCALPGRIAAVVSVAGSVIPASCASPVTNLFEIHGAADPIAPWDGGGPARTAPFAGVTTQPVTERLGRYAQDTGCTAAATTQQLPGLGALTSWTCNGKPDVGALSVAGGGHTWPQAPAHPELGPTATAFSATVVSLLYFQSHPVLGTVVSPTSPSLAQSLGNALGAAGN
jgi:polyhydroxybutyrate depolymerase